MNPQTESCPQRSLTSTGTRRRQGNRPVTARSAGPAFPGQGGWVLSASTAGSTLHGPRPTCSRRLASLAYIVVRGEANAGREFTRTVISSTNPLFRTRWVYVHYCLTRCSKAGTASKVQRMPMRRRAATAQPLHRRLNGGNLSPRNPPRRAGCRQRHASSARASSRCGTVTSNRAPAQHSACRHYRPRRLRGQQGAPGRCPPCPGNCCHLKRRRAGPPPHRRPSVGGWHSMPVMPTVARRPGSWPTASE